MTEWLRGALLTAGWTQTMTTMKRLDIGIVIGSEGHLLLSVFYNKISISLEKFGTHAFAPPESAQECIVIPCEVA